MTEIWKANPLKKSNQLKNIINQDVHNHCVLSISFHAYTTLNAFKDINGAHLLMLSMSDPTDISLVLAFIEFQWLHMAASNYQSMFT